MHDMQVGAVRGPAGRAVIVSLNWCAMLCLCSAMPPMRASTLLHHHNASTLPHCPQAPLLGCATTAPLLCSATHKHLCSAALPQRLCSAMLPMSASTPLRHHSAFAPAAAVTTNAPCHALPCRPQVPLLGCATTAPPLIMAINANAPRCTPTTALVSNMLPPWPPDAPPPQPSATQLLQPSPLMCRAPLHGRHPTPMCRHHGPLLHSRRSHHL